MLIEEALVGPEAIGDEAGLVRTKRAGAVRLLEEDPELGRHLGPEARAAAGRSLVASVRSLSPGVWDPRADSCAHASDLGLLVLEGVMIRRVAVGARHSAELLAAGDLVRPVQPECDQYAEVRHVATWRVLSPVRVAVLDQELVDGVAGLRGVIGELAGRAVDRVRSLALLLAIAQTPELAARLRLVLWHLADRWGRRCARGVVIELPFGQETLGELSAAQRTSVNEALKTLEDRELLERPRRGQIVLIGPPPNAESDPPPRAKRFARGMSARRHSAAPRFGLPTLAPIAVRPADTTA
jgi:hypothetical protein